MIGHAQTVDDHRRLFSQLALMVQHQGQGQLASAAITNEQGVGGGFAEFGDGVAQFVGSR